MDPRSCLSLCSLVSSRSLLVLHRTKLKGLEKCTAEQILSWAMSTEPINQRPLPPGVDVWAMRNMVLALGQVSTSSLPFQPSGGGTGQPFNQVLNLSSTCAAQLEVLFLCSRLFA